MGIAQLRTAVEHAAATHAHYIAKLAQTNLQVKQTKEAREKEKEEYRIAMEEVTARHATLLLQQGQDHTANAALQEEMKIAMKEAQESALSAQAHAGQQYAQIEKLVAWIAPAAQQAGLALGLNPISACSFRKGSPVRNRLHQADRFFLPFLPMSQRQCRHSSIPHRPVILRKSGLWQTCWEPGQSRKWWQLLRNCLSHWEQRQRRQLAHWAQGKW